MRRNPKKQLLAVAAALGLGGLLLIYPKRDERDEWPGRRDGGGTWGHADTIDLLPR